MEASVNSSHNDSLHMKMKSLISEIDKYLTVRTEDSGFLINKHLQTFSVTIDTNIFDPDTILGAKFFVSLHNLLTKTEPQSQMSWYCVDVLCNACHNSSARRALIDTYNLIPSLSRLLGDQLTDMKKKKLLKLMQDLSCGIKISWQIPHLTHLLKTLTKWVENQNQEIICLSLGVLVNLCYKNLPAMYALSKCVDIKKFLRFCIPLKGSITEIHVCKLMVILDFTHVDLPNYTLMQIVETTFVSIFESYKNSDAIVLKQIVDFFSDVTGQSKDKQIMKEYQHYENRIETLLQLVDSNIGNSSGDSAYSSSNNNPECISIILEFMHSIMQLGIESITRLYPKILTLAINWVNSEWVSFSALVVLTEIVENLETTENKQSNAEILQSLVASLPIFLLILQSNITPTNMESYRKLGAVLQLLRGMLQSPSICASVIQALNEEMIGNVFAPLQSDNFNVECLPMFKSNGMGFTSTDAVNTYLHALSLVNDLAQHGADWLDLQRTLMENRKIHMIIAHALYGGTREIKALALEISRHPNLPVREVASAMCILHPMFSDFNESRDKVQTCMEVDCPMLSFVQTERLDDTLERLNKLMDEGNVANISTSQLLELYDHKVATLGYAEKIALTSAEAASERCSQLQHRLALITAEQNKMQQLMFHKQHCLELTIKSKTELKELYTQEQNRTQTVLGKIKVYESQIKSKDKALKECETQIMECTKGMKEMSDDIAKLNEQLVKKEKLIVKLGESGNKSERNLQKSEELLKKANLEIKNLNSHVMQLEEKLNIKELRLAELTEQYHQKKKILDTITKVATSSHDP